MTASTALTRSAMLAGRGTILRHPAAVTAIEIVEPEYRLAVAQRGLVDHDHPDRTAIRYLRPVTERAGQPRGAQCVVTGFP
jgi:hypothetical protein